MRKTVLRWLTQLGRRYGESVAQDEAHERVRPVPRPAELDRFEGMWVAVIDGEVAVAELTSHKLALKLRDMDHRRRQRATIEYVRPRSDAYIVGVG